MTCYNCRKPGHLSNQCPELQVSFQQYNTNREAIQVQERQCRNRNLRPQQQEIQKAQPMNATPQAAMSSTVLVDLGLVE
jgi:hypothetical protein